MNNELMKKTLMCMAVFALVCQQLNGEQLPKIAAALTLGFFMTAKFIEPQLLKTTPLPDEKLFWSSAITGAIGTAMHLDPVKQKVMGMSHEKKTAPQVPGQGKTTSAMDTKATMIHSALFGASLLAMNQLKDGVQTGLKQQ